MESVRATVVEGKEAAAEKMTMVKDTVVEKVYSSFYFTLVVAIGVNPVPMKVKAFTTPRLSGMPNCRGSEIIHMSRPCRPNT